MAQVIWLVPLLIKHQITEVDFYHNINTNIVVKTKTREMVLCVNWHKTKIDPLWGNSDLLSV